MSTKDSNVLMWTKFFKDAGIPAGLGTNYAILFCDHRIQKNLLGDLNREILVEMGIKAMGDIICILKQADIVSQQVTRENTSKLIASPKTDPSKSAATRMITHTINSRDFSSKSSTPERNPKNAETPSSKSVFSRLGQDGAVETSASGVFGRLGDPVPGKAPNELPYAGVLKKDETVDLTTPKTSKVKMVKIKLVPPPPMSKRKSVMERLGPAEKSSGSPPKIKRVSMSPGVKKVAAKKKSPPVEEEDVEEEVKTVTIIRTFSGGEKPKKKLISNKKTTVMDRKDNLNVLTRLGGHVTSSTNQNAAVLKLRTKQPVLKKTIRNETTKKTNPKKSGVLHMKRPLAAKKPAEPISINLVSSTTSAGIFGRGKVNSSSSVFDRLGGV